MPTKRPPHVTRPPRQLIPIELVLHAKSAQSPTGWYHSDTEHWVDNTTKQRPAVGTVFYLPEGLAYPLQASPHYHKVKHLRRPIVIVLPTTTGPDDPGQWWCVDELSSREIAKQIVNGKGWQVSGRLLNGIAVRPSIRTGPYHGYVEDGKLRPCGDTLVW